MSGSLSKSYSAQYCVSSSDSEDDPGFLQENGDVEKVETTKLGKEVDATNLPECILGRSIRSATIFTVVNQWIMTTRSGWTGSREKGRTLKLCQQKIVEDLMANLPVLDSLVKPR